MKTHIILNKNLANCQGSDNEIVQTNFIILQHKLRPNLRSIQKFMIILYYDIDIIECAFDLKHISQKFLQLKRAIRIYRTTFKFNAQ